MGLYFYLLDHRTFHESIRPALAATGRFSPLHRVGRCVQNLPRAAHAFQQQFHVSEQDLLTPQIATGLRFDRDFWRLLVGEILLVAASEVPEMQTAAESLCCLLPLRCRIRRCGPPPRGADWQAHFGSRDLAFGAAIYRPEPVGWNDADDVARLAAYLAEIDTRPGNPSSYCRLQSWPSRRIGRKNWPMPASGFPPWWRCSPCKAERANYRVRGTLR